MHLCLSSFFLKIIPERRNLAKEGGEIPARVGTRDNLRNQWGDRNHQPETRGGLPI